MPRLNIPKAHRVGMSMLLGWAPETFDQFVKALDESPPGIAMLSELPASIKTSNINREDILSAVSVVLGLNLARSAASEVTLDNFVRDASEAIAVFDEIGRKEESTKRLYRLLRIDSLVGSARAVSLLTDHQRTLHSCSILTDIRYAFQPNPEDEPYGAVIFHTLKLNYHEFGEHRDFYVALDGNDIENLKKALVRAEAKVLTLKKKLAQADVPYLGGADKSSKGS